MSRENVDSKINCIVLPNFKRNETIGIPAGIFTFWFRINLFLRTLNNEIKNTVSLGCYAVVIIYPTSDNPLVGQSNL